MTTPSDAEILASVLRRIDALEARSVAHEAALGKLLPPVAPPPVTPPPVDPPKPPAPPVGGVQKTGTGYKLIQDLQGATLAAKFKTAVGSAISFKPEKLIFKDFGAAYGASPNFAGINVPAGVTGLSGASRETTILEIVPKSSTKAGLVPTAKHTTNQLQLITVLNAADGFRLEDLTVRGTDQGHLYNGVYLARPTGAITVKNVTVEAVPGDAGAPPGETFVMSLYRSSTKPAVFENVTIDGKGVGAAGLGLNNTAGPVEINNFYATGMRFSAGIAAWQVQAGSVVNIRNSHMTGNRRNLGAEAIAGTINVFDPVWGDPQETRYDINFTWGLTGTTTWKNGAINFYFSSEAAWQRFLAARKLYKQIRVVTNTKVDYGKGPLPSGTYQDPWTKVKVYFADASGKYVERKATDYIDFFGDHSL